jgi:hypothetical protein
LSFKDGVLGVAGAVGAPADPAAGGAAVDAVVAGTPPPPLHPASNSKVSTAPAGDPWRQPDLESARSVPRVIANSRSQIAIANLWRLSQCVPQLG